VLADVKFHAGGSGRTTISPGAFPENAMAARTVATVTMCGMAADRALQPAAGVH